MSIENIGKLQVVNVLIVGFFGHSTMLSAQFEEAANFS